MMWTRSLFAERPCLGSHQTSNFTYLGVPKEALSGLEKFEAPDPAEWCPRGYAVVQVDARGCYDSEGDIFVFGTQVCSLKCSACSNEAHRWCRKEETVMILWSGSQSKNGAMAVLLLSATLGLRARSGSSLLNSLHISKQSHHGRDWATFTDRAFAEVVYQTGSSGNFS